METFFFLSTSNISYKKKEAEYIDRLPLDDGRMTEACCGSNIGRGEEDLLR
jgi:hypothetical protein